MEFIKKIIEKINIKELFGITFVAALILTLIPKEFLAKMHLLNFKTKYQTYISLCILIIGSYYVLQIMVFIRKFILHKIINSNRRVLKYIKYSMSQDEMGLIIETFYDREMEKFRISGKIDYSDGRKAPLQSNGVIYLSSTLGDIYDGFSYNLQSYVLTFLNENLEKGNIIVSNSMVKYKFQ